MENYENLGKIGEGTYGVVLKCRNRTTGKLVAIKKFKESDDNEQVRKTAMREVRLLRMMKHANVVDLIEVFRRKQKLYLVFEYVERTVLEDLEAKEGGMDLHEVKKVLYQLLKSVHFCHSQNVVHRDIKPENMLMSSEGVLKLCDFGFARTLPGGSNAKLSAYVSTRWYRAPELLVGDVHYDAGVDIWAVGCMLVEMLTGVPLFPGDSDVDQLWLIIKCMGSLIDRHVDFMQKNPALRCIRTPQQSELEPLHKRFPHLGEPVHEFLRMCLNIDPEKRLSSGELLNTPFFDGIPQLFNEPGPPVASSLNSDSLSKEVVAIRERTPVDDAHTPKPNRSCAGIAYCEIASPSLEGKQNGSESVQPTTASPKPREKAPGVHSHLKHPESPLQSRFQAANDSKPSAVGTLPGVLEKTALEAPPMLPELGGRVLATPQTSFMQEEMRGMGARHASTSQQSQGGARVPSNLHQRPPQAHPVHAQHLSETGRTTTSALGMRESTGPSRFRSLEAQMACIQGEGLPVVGSKERQRPRQVETLLQSLNLHGDRSMNSNTEDVTRRSTNGHRMAPSTHNEDARTSRHTPNNNFPTLSEYQFHLQDSRGSFDALPDLPGTTHAPKSRGIRTADHARSPLDAAPRHSHHPPHGHHAKRTGQGPSTAATPPQHQPQPRMPSVRVHASPSHAGSGTQERTTVSLKPGDRQPVLFDVRDLGTAPRQISTSNGTRVLSPRSLAKGLNQTNAAINGQSGRTGSNLHSQHSIRGTWDMKSDVKHRNQRPSATVGLAYGKDVLHNSSNRARRKHRPAL
mmetsp:Transcript_32080/g.61738  ORF Transcript_32080/g.61738 Transcript_32080/m.61738 type:complete len:798 (-) Transcript_32080:136-2529(-)